MGHLGIFASSISGLVFGTAWWLFIDGCAQSNNMEGTTNNVEFLDALPMTGGTIFFILLVSFGWERMDADDMQYDGCSNVQTWARICLFFDIMIGFGSCVGSAILLAERWAKGDRDPYFGVIWLGANGCG
eukprot:152083_1